MKITIKDPMKLLLSALTLTWFVCIPAIIYLVMYWNKIGMLEKILVVLTIIVPVVPSVFLILNALDIFKLPA